MTLRIMLVGLVASMGLELPSGAEVSACTRSGRDWVHARLGNPSGPVVEADWPEAELADCRQADASEATLPPAIVEVVAAPADAAFLAATEEMAAGFKADSMSMRDDEASPREDVAEITPAKSLPVGLPEGEELAVVVGSDDDDEVTTEMELSPTRAERVISALRLTREAVQAWSELMQESPDEACPTR
jgi:hypothetical protein